MDKTLCPVKHTSNVYNELNEYFKTDSNSAIQNITTDDRNFLAEITEKYFNNDCKKTGKKCQCMTKVSKDGFYVYCNFINGIITFSDNEYSSCINPVNYMILTNSIQSIKFCMI